jgi:hypothetical protein
MGSRELLYGDRVYVNRKDSNDTGNYIEKENVVYYITEADHKATSEFQYCIWSTPKEAEGEYIGWFSREELELVEEESALDKVIVINPTKDKIAEEFDRLTEPKKEYTYSQVEDDLFTIYNKDLEFYSELEKLIKYLASTYNDKYEESSKYVFVPKEGLTKEVALWNTSKYLRRYSTTGFTKSEDTRDVLKAIHYLLMENKRKNKYGN